MTVGAPAAIAADSIMVRRRWCVAGRLLSALDEWKESPAAEPVDEADGTDEIMDDLLKNTSVLLANKGRLPEAVEAVAAASTDQAAGNSGATTSHEIALGQRETTCLPIARQTPGEFTWKAKVLLTAIDGNSGHARNKKPVVRLVVIA